MDSMVNNVLHYSYDPSCRYSGLPDAVVETATERSHSGDVETLAAKTVDALAAAVDAEMSEVSDDATHVVPLSSGLDSRALLATLLDRPDVEPSSVRTVTFGSPGTWDYEIGRRVAEVAGVRNTAIDLTAESFDWSLDSLRDYAAERRCPGGMFDGYVHAKVPAIAPAESAVWVGFLGDLSAGVWQPADPYDEWTEARAHFAERERYATGLTAPEFDPRSALPDEPFVSRRRLSYVEQLDIALRQRCAIEPVVIPSAEYRAPFTHPTWLECSLNLPAKHRRKRALFVDAFAEAFPALFELPTDANAGFPVSVGETKRKVRLARLRLMDRVSTVLGVNYTHPGTNYRDFGSAFRSGQLRDAASELIDEFAERDVAAWLDPRALWREHQAGADRTREIQVICYAELYLSESARSHSSAARCDVAAAR